MDLNEATNWKSRPAEWSDDERMNALFSPFRARELNPIYYDAKMNFWKKAISSYLNDQKIVRFKVKDLEEAFMRNGTKPKCLNKVVESILNDTNSKIKERNSFMNKQSWLTFAFTRLVWSPLTWTTSYLISKTDLGSRLSFTKNPVDIQDGMGDSCEYVFLEQLTIKSHEIHVLLNSDLIFNDIDCICDYERFVSVCTSHGVALDDIDLILVQLVNDKHLLINANLIKNKKLIKFMPINQTSNAQATRQIDDITELEFNYYLLKLNETNFEKQVNTLNRQLNELMDQVKLNLKQKNKKMALNCLKKYKYYEKQMDQKSQVLFNLQNLMLNLQQISTNKTTIDIYKKNLNLIKEFNDQNNLGNVEDLIDDLNENFKVNSEIEDALSRTANIHGSFVDDSELESELNDLVATKTLTDQTTIDSHNLSIDDLLNDLPKLSISTTNEKSPKVRPISNNETLDQQ
jgi:charged multivesicular body protein 7